MVYAKTSLKPLYLAVSLFFFVAAWVCFVPNTYAATIKDYNSSSTYVWPIGKSTSAGEYEFAIKFTTDDWYNEIGGNTHWGGQVGTPADGVVVKLCEFDSDSNPCGTLLDADNFLASETEFGDYANFEFDDDIYLDPDEEYVIVTTTSVPLDASNYSRCARGAANSETNYIRDGGGWTKYTTGDESRACRVYIQGILTSDPDAPLNISISATGTDEFNTIGFSGNFPIEGNGLLVGETITSVSVRVFGLAAGQYEYSYSPPSPIGRVLSESNSLANSFQYPNGIYTVYLDVVTNMRSGSASSSTISFDAQSIFDLGAPFVSSTVTGDVGYNFSASASSLIGGNLVITSDECGGLVASASGIKAAVLCNTNRFQAIPPFSWISGIYKAGLAAYETQNATGTQRVRLAISGGGYDIVFFDSASGTQVLRERALAMFPNYYSVLELLLWFNFVMQIVHHAHILSDKTFGRLIDDK